MTLLLLALAGSTPPPSVAKADPDIVVTAPCRMTARQLRPALKAFRNERQKRSPDSILFFEADPAARRDGVTLTSLRLRSDGRTRAIVGDAEGRFILPATLADDVEIMGPCHDGALAISPLVMSPGTVATDRRLGDMRLQCAVGWAMTRHSMSVATGVFMRVLGECGSSRIAIYAGSARPIADAAVTRGTATWPVRISEGGHRYSVPLADKRMPDAARVRFRFQ